MYTDEIVEEVRRVREKYAAKFDFDISKICADIRKQQKKSGRIIVSRISKDRDDRKLPSARPTRKAA